MLNDFIKSQRPKILTRKRSMSPVMRSTYEDQLIGGYHILFSCARKLGNAKGLMTIEDVKTMLKAAYMELIEGKNLS